MKKDIYKEIPENFHRQFCQTLMELEDSHSPRKKKPHRRKYGILLAAAILAIACATAVAAGLMGWHEHMSTRFGTDKNLEDKLSSEQVAIPQSATVEESRLKFQALQAVRTDSYDYFLIQMFLPEEITWNDDILFENTQVIDQDWGCIANFVSDSFENNTVLLELQLFYPEEIVPSAKEIRVRLKNLIQTNKTEIMSYLLKGQWEIPLTLPPAEADTVCFYPNQAITLGEHEIQITQAAISPFMLRLYTEKELALHATWGHSVFLTGVHYKDGTLVEESGLTFSLSGHLDESKNFGFEFPLENAVDPEQISSIVIEDGGEERMLALGLDAASAPESSVPQIQKQPAIQIDQKISDLRLLYVKYDNVILADDKSVYLWDALCGGAKELFSLDNYGFSWENGGEVSFGQASQMLLLPYAGSSEVYLYNIASQEMLTLETEAFWPWPTHESYLANCKSITEVVSEADENYSGQAFFSQGKWYYLYSPDGSVQNMELRSKE